MNHLCRSPLYALYTIGRYSLLMCSLDHHYSSAIIPHQAPILSCTFRSQNIKTLVPAWTTYTYKIWSIATKQNLIALVNHLLMSPVSFVLLVDVHLNVLSICTTLAIIPCFITNPLYIHAYLLADTKLLCLENHLINVLFGIFDFVYFLLEVNKNFVFFFFCQEEVNMTWSRIYMDMI